MTPQRLSPRPKAHWSGCCRLSSSIQRLSVERLAAGDVLVRQGCPDQADVVFLLFDGLLDVEIDGSRLAAQVGPGAIVGEAAGLQVKRRSATLRAVTACRVARVPGAVLDHAALARLAAARRPPPARPEQPSRGPGRPGA